MRPRNLAILSLLFIPGCIDAPTYVEGDAGTTTIDASIDATPGNAELTTTQLPFGFGDVAVGGMSATLEVTVRNTGTDASGTLDVSLTGADPGEFEIVDAGADDCDGKTLEPDATCIASVRFHPGAAGAMAATLEVDASPGGTASVDLTGTGLSPGALEITAGDPLVFAMVEIASMSLAQTITVHNTGQTDTATLETVVGDATSYSTMNDTCDGAPLGPDDTCSVDVIFNPATVGSLPTQISVRESPTVGVPASATGTGTARLQITKVGTGAVSSAPGGINCGTGCTVPTTGTFSQTPVTLTATDGGGFLFDGWTGGCTGASSMCTVPLTVPLTMVTATFVRVYSLDVSTIGAGTVVSAPGISCGNGLTDCSEVYETGTMVTLTATPDANFEVFSWSGAPGCTQGMHECIVLMDQLRSVTVEFKRQYTVTVVPGGSGTGTITGGAINCPGTCTATQYSGTMLTLTEAPGTPGANSQILFGGWSGGTCAGTGTTCNVNFDADRTVNAAFTLRHRLSVTISGTGLGSTSGSGAFNCASGTCTQYYDAGLVVTLTALPSNGTNSYFGAYTGACTGIARVCGIMMTAPLAVTARFDPQPGNLVFVSSVAYAANLGGTAPYDAACNSLATAAGFNTAGDNGFIAWMSAPGSLAKDRLGATTRGFVRIDGLPFADDQATLLTSPPKTFYPIVHDENGTDPGPVSYFTATNTAGNLIANRHCQGWTTTSEAPNGAWGAVTHTGMGGWTEWTSLLCGGTGRLMCVGKTSTSAIAPTPVAGKRMYLTNADLIPSGSSPDTACDAAKPGGTGAVHAVIATTTASAASKLTAGVSYVRPDGVLVGTGGQFIAGSLVSGAWQAGNGSYFDGYSHSGSTDIGSLGTAASTCSNWTDPSSVLVSKTAFTAAPRPPFWWGYADAECSFPARYLCVEE